MRMVINVPVRPHRTASQRGCRCRMWQVHPLDMNDPAVRLKFDVFAREVESPPFASRPLITDLASRPRIIDTDGHRPTFRSKQPFLDELRVVWARYTASGGAANRLVTTTWVLPSVFRVNLLIVFLLFSSSVVPAPARTSSAGRKFFSALFATLRATGPLLNAASARRRGRFAPSTRRSTSPASSRTLRCWEIAGCVISKGLPAHHSRFPLARRARIARRVGSAKAEKAASRFNVSDISNILYKRLLMVKRKSAWTGHRPLRTADLQVRQFRFVLTTARVRSSLAITHNHDAPRRGNIIWFAISDGHHVSSNCAVALVVICLKDSPRNLQGCYQWVAARKHIRAAEHFLHWIAIETCRSRALKNDMHSSSSTT